MHLTIFGASGATGLLLTERALAAGHTVTVLVRKPEQFPFRGRTHTLQGSVFEAEPVLHALAGADAVLSALGARSWRKENVLERAMPVIVRTMEQYGPKRLIALGSAGARPDSMKLQPAWQRWMVKNLLYTTILHWPVASQVAQYEVLAGSELEWTMAMPPMLINAPARGRIRVSGEALPPGASRISRADVADFMMAQLHSTEWVRQGVYVTW